MDPCLLYERVSTICAISGLRNDKQKLKYCKVSNISRNKSQSSNASRLILYLYLPNPLKPGVKLKMKM